MAGAGTAAPGTSTREALSPGQFFGEVVGRYRASGVVLSELRHARRRVFPSHSHRLAYFCLLLSGRYEERVAGRSFAQRPMTLAFHPPGMDHRDEVGERGGTFFSVEVEAEWLERLRDEGRVHLGFAVLSFGEPLWLAARLYRELRAGDACSALAIEGLVLELLAAAGRLARVEERRPPGWLPRVEDMLRERFRDGLTLDALAVEAGVHPAYLSRTFRRFRGRTPGQLLQELRVRAVCQGLADPDRSLADLALEAGFADQSHCTRVFKRVTGMTPGAFRTAGRALDSRGESRRCEGRESSSD
jgi:AraC family transcriptional regulator